MPRAAFPSRIYELSAALDLAASKAAAISVMFFVSSMGCRGERVVQDWKSYPIKWACCARNEAKAAAAVKTIADRVGASALPPIEVACLISDEAKLRAVVKKTKVVLTCAGPFEKYSQTLVKVCAEEGVHYADITGESDFFRKMIAEHDATAQKTGATIVIHCGNDAIPWDLTVFEMSKLARSKGAELAEAWTYGEFGATAAASGGTLTTAIFQLGKRRGGAKPDFDPLLKRPDGSKSESLTKIANPKQDVYCDEFAQYGGPWIMGPVMANCALLGYSASLTYADVMLRGHPTWAQWAGAKANEALVGAAVMAPRVFARFLPAPGEGPSREDMDAGYLKLHGRGRILDGDGKETPLNLKSTYHFPLDTGYLMTAQMLVETGMVLLEKAKAGPGGVLTPAAALGSDIVARLDKELDAKFELSEGCERI